MSATSIDNLVSTPELPGALGPSYTSRVFPVKSILLLGRDNLIWYYALPSPPFRLKEESHETYSRLCLLHSAASSPRGPRAAQTHCRRLQRHKRHANGLLHRQRRQDFRKVRAVRYSGIRR